MQGLEHTGVLMEFMPQAKTIMEFTPALVIPGFMVTALPMAYMEAATLMAYMVQAITGCMVQELLMECMVILEAIMVYTVILVIMEFMVQDRKSTRLNSSHPSISYAVFCLKKKK